MKNLLKTPYIWLFLGFAFLLFSYGNRTVPLAPWLASVFLVRFYRVKDLEYFPIVPLAIILSLFFTLRGILPASGFLEWGLLFLMGALFSTPFLLDRLFYSRVEGFKATFLLPLAGVSFEFLNTIVSPYGSWGSLAYSQYGNLPLMQLVSITGLWGITFMLLWFPSMVNWVWERDFDTKKVKKGSLIFIVVFVTVMLVGGLRVAGRSPDSGTVKFSSITVPTNFFGDSEFWRSYYSVRRGDYSPGDIEVVREKFNQLHDNLARLTVREARAGSEIIFWHEGNGLVLEEDEGELVGKISNISKQYDAYIMLSLATVKPDRWKLGNKVVLINPEGEQEFTYLKANPVPGEACLEGKETLKVATTPYGKLSSAICYDMDFPNLIRQAGRKNVDIMLVPASDWREIDPFHAQMAVFRAVESSFNMVRQTNQGLSLATNYRGRVLSSMDYFKTEDRVMVAHVPTEGVNTVYGKIGDFFAWVCITGLLTLAGLSFRSKF